MVDSLLPADALKGVRLAISVSESADLPRLGLLDSHLRMALGEVTRCVIVSGGSLTYGGNLDPSGYAPFLVHELSRYSRRDRPLRLCLAWSEHRKLTLSRIQQQRTELGLFGELVCLAIDGTPVDAAAGRQEVPPTPADNDTVQRSLTGLRRYMSTESRGRVLMGGRREGYAGVIPGLLEEALIALDHGQPLYLAGGFGGITADIARRLNVDGGHWLPSIEQVQWTDATQAAFQKLEQIHRAAEWTGPNNGLSTEENRRLARTHRASEVAAFVSLGLGRRFAATAPP